MWAGRHVTLVGHMHGRGGDHPFLLSPLSTHESYCTALTPNICGLSVIFPVPSPYLSHACLPQHADEHDDDCIGSRHVAVTRPVNNECPSQSTLFDAQVCDVPALCGANGSPLGECPKGEFLRFDVSVLS